MGLSDTQTIVGALTQCFTNSLYSFLELQQGES